jgi:hypothetical protein
MNGSNKTDRPVAPLIECPIMFLRCFYTTVLYCIVLVFQFFYKYVKKMISPVFKYMRVDCNRQTCVYARDLPVPTAEYSSNIRFFYVMI